MCSTTYLHTACPNIPADLMRILPIISPFSPLPWWVQSTFDISEVGCRQKGTFCCTESFTMTKACCYSKEEAKNPYCLRGKFLLPEYVCGTSLCSTRTALVSQELDDFLPHFFLPSIPNLGFRSRFSLEVSWAPSPPPPLSFTREGERGEKWTANRLSEKGTKHFLQEKKKRFSPLTCCSSVSLSRTPPPHPPKKFVPQIFKRSKTGKGAEFPRKLLRKRICVFFQTFFFSLFTSIP